MPEIRTTVDGGIDVVELIGDHDMSTAQEVDAAIGAALSDATTSCILDLASASFVDSSVIALMLRWSKETQVSEREALAIVVGPPTTPAAHLLRLVNLLGRLPVFGDRASARAALVEGRRPREERRYGWLTDRELADAREAARVESESDGDTEVRDAAILRLGDIVREQQRRQRGR